MDGQTVKKYQRARKRIRASNCIAISYGHTHAHTFEHYGKPKGQTHADTRESINIVRTALRVIHSTPLCCCYYYCCCRCCCCYSDKQQIHISYTHKNTGTLLFVSSSSSPRRFVVFVVSFTRSTLLFFS